MCVRVCNKRRQGGHAPARRLHYGRVGGPWRRGNEAREAQVSNLDRCVVLGRSKEDVLGLRGTGVGRASSSVAKILILGG